MFKPLFKHDKIKIPQKAYGGIMAHKKIVRKASDVCRARSNGPNSIVITIKKSIVRKMKIKHDDKLLVTFKKIDMDEILERAMNAK
jgi:hypothetical protein